jgi:hypothetical protein
VAGGRQATSSSGDLHGEIQRVYNFQPHTLNDAQIAQKSALLDEFWTKAKSQREVYVPGLRRELADFSNPAFFLFDGSKLLMSLSKDPADRKIILSAIAQSDLRDLQLKDYFLLVHKHGGSGRRHDCCRISHPGATEIPSVHSPALLDAGAGLLLDLYAVADQSRFLA